MIYINLSDNIQDYLPEDFLKFPKFIKKIIYIIRKKNGCLYIKELEDKILINIPEINSKSLRRLERYIKVKCINTVCLSKELSEDKNVLEFLNGQDVNILEGKWLSNYLIINVINYVIQNKKERAENQEVSLLINKVDEIWLENIKDLARRVKLLNIVTHYEERFKKVEKELYEQEGILLNINNNLKKVLLKTDLIVNVDFSEEEFNEYNIPKKCCIISLNKNEKINYKGFEGIHILNYEISLPRKYLKYIISLKNFDNTILYESFIYKRTTYKNIKNEIENDEIKILCVNGKNGKIRKSEFINISKNKNGFKN